MNADTRSLLAVLSLLAIAATACSDSSASEALPTDEDATEVTLTSSTILPTDPTDRIDEPASVEAAGAADGDGVDGTVVEIGEVFLPDGSIVITNGEGGFAADIGNADRFGRDHDRAGDIDGDGVVDLVVGARSDDDGPSSTDGLTDAGAVYILFMEADGTVRSHQKISSLDGGFSTPLVEDAFFGYGVAGIGDYDGDGIPDVAASAPGSRQIADGFEPSVYILHLNADGTVKSTVAAAGVAAEGLSAVGDLDGDGRVDLVAADPNGGEAGRIHLLFFDEDSALRADDVVTIGDDQGGFDGQLSAGDSFGGRESALLGDLDGDGGPELAVGAFTSDSGTGAVWILSLDGETHEVISEAKVTPGVPGFDEVLPLAENENGTSGGHFGHALVAGGDLDGDGVPDLITSANQYETGVVYAIYLNPDKTVKGFTRITGEEAGFDLTLADDERFGRSMSIVDDDRADGEITLNVGGGAGVQRGGAIYALTLNLD
ncbi:MAG: integrin alpha [Actinomycetota bacterium]